MSFDQQHTLLT